MEIIVTNYTKFLNRNLPPWGGYFAQSYKICVSVQGSVPLNRVTPIPFKYVVLAARVVGIASPEMIGCMVFFCCVAAKKHHTARD
jgi:hypothetical protein